MPLNFESYLAHHLDTKKKYGFSYLLIITFGGHSGIVVTYLPPTSEVGGLNPGPFVGKFVVAY